MMLQIPSVLDRARLERVHELLCKATFIDGKLSAGIAAGDAVVYPSASLHHVADVTAGERIVAITWAQSMIRDAAKRELLYGLNQARETLLRNNPEAEESRQVDISYANLFRMWAEL